MSGLGTDASAINVTPEIEKALRNATSAEEMKALLHAEAIRTGLVVADPMNSEILHETELSQHAKNRSKQITVNSQTYTLTGSTDAELAEAETNLYRTLLQPTQQQEQVRTEQPRNDRGQYVSAEDAALDSAVENYLQRRGIDPAALRAKTDEQYFANWSAASEDFRRRRGEWAGGQQNMQTLGEIVFELGLQDSPSADSLEIAFNEMQKRGLYQRDTAEAQAARAEAQIGSAQSVEEIRSLGRKAIGLPPVNSNFRS